ncbi:hypothetical protein BH24CHL10_BH24CHL10_06880 [soil metagenome]
MQSSSPGLTRARAVFAFIGIGTITMGVTNPTSGQSLTDPVMPAGLALGAAMVRTAAWVGASDGLRVTVVWLGVGAAAIATAVIGFSRPQTPSSDVIALVAVPSLVMIAAGTRLAAAQVAARTSRRRA